MPAHGTIGLTIDRGADVGLHATAADGADVSYDAAGHLVVSASSGGAKTVSLSNGTTVTATVPAAGDPITLNAWHLDVDEISPSGHTAHSLDLPALKDWRDIPELASAVGSAMYTTSVTVPDQWLGSGRSVALDLGQLVGAVRVYVNGQPAGEQTTPGWVRVVGDLLHAGSNTIAVRLDTTLLNRAAQLRTAGNPAYQTGPVPPLGQTVATPVVPEANGLLGPVRLIPSASVTFVTSTGSIGGTVPATLALTLGPPASFGTFTPGADRSYDASTTATVTSTAGDASLSVTDPSSTATGRLVNGSFALNEPLLARAGSASFAPLSTTAGSPLTLLTYAGPVSNDAVTIGLRQHIGSAEPLRTGSYSKTLAFTLSTTTP